MRLAPADARAADTPMRLLVSEHSCCYYQSFCRRAEDMSTEAPALELKQTINLPKTKFAQKANLPQSEPARLKQWAEQDLYQPISSPRAGAEKLILPYA